MAMETAEVGDNNKRRKTMATVAEKVTCHEDVPWNFIGDNKRRVLDVYYTTKGTKLFVENGTLVEESTQPSPSPFPVYPHFDISSLPGVSTSDPKVKRPSPSQKASLLASLVAQRHRTAVAALEYYNSKHCAKLSLVNPVSSSGHLLVGIWYHCNFTAKPEGHEDSSAKLFFAEMKVVKCGKEYLVTAFCPVDDDSETTKDCTMCKNGIMVHPTSGLLRGHSETI